MIKTFFKSKFFFPLLFVLITWVVKSFEELFNVSFIRFGIHPRDFKGLVGIITAPLIHGDWKHLISNTLPLLILGWIIFYFYKGIAFQVFFWVYIMTGIWVWSAARDAYHIGASGLVYGFVCFLFFSGIIRKNIRLMGLSMFVVFVYGSLVWGIFPLHNKFSWESHAFGSLAGIITAFYFKNEGPKTKVYDWGEEEDDSSETENPQQINEEDFSEK